MPIDNVPAVQSIIEQTNLLERRFNDPLEALLAYTRLSDNEMFPNGIGETFTKTRPALFPLSAALTPLNPANNVALDNGLTDQYYPFEQYQLAINEYALSTTVNIKQDRTLIQRIFLQNVYALAENAARTLEALTSQTVHNASQSGATFCTTAVSAGQTTIHVDNLIGFDKVFSSTNSPGLPTATSGSNLVTFSVINGTTGAVKAANITGNLAVFDATNTSTMIQGGVAYGKSGTITLSSAYAGTAAVAGDTVIATDGSYVLRPNAKQNRYQLASTDVVTLQLFAQATAKLRARNVPPLPNGNYVAIIDPVVWPQLTADPAFQYATMGSMGTGYYKNALVNQTLGIEFINSTMVPAYTTNTAGVVARHAIVAGRGAMIKGTFQGHVDAARQAGDMQNSDIRLLGQQIALITRGPLDRLQQFVTQSWNWVGAFTAPTDYTSTPLIIPTTDNCRYKRFVEIEVATAY